MTREQLARQNELVEENRNLKRQNQSLRLLLSQSNAERPIQRGVPSPFAVFAEGLV